MLRLGAVPGLFLLLSCVASGAQPTECSLIVRVTGQDMRPIPGVQVRLEDTTGYGVFSGRTDGGETRICDFGFGRHTLRVGMNECLPVVVENVRLTPGTPQVIQVILNRCGGVGGRNFCTAYLRLKTSDGRGLAEASIVDSAGRTLATSDGYGRATFGLPRGSTRTVTVTAPDGRRQDVTLECRTIEDVEREVVLF